MALLANLVLGNCALKTLTRASRPSFSLPACHQVTTLTWLASPSPTASPDLPSFLSLEPQAARVAASAVAVAPIST